MIIDIVHAAGDWPDIIQPITKRIGKTVDDHFDFADDEFECALLLTDDQKMRQLNSEFRDRAQATNVLSWPSVDLANPGGTPKPPKATPPIPSALGDIALGYETCRNEAKLISFQDHITHLILHGILHLLGYDHMTQEDAEIMETLEIRLLASLDISNPYGCNEMDNDNG